MGELKKFTHRQAKNVKAVLASVGKEDLEDVVVVGGNGDILFISHTISTSKTNLLGMMDVAKAYIIKSMTEVE